MHVESSAPTENKKQRTLCHFQKFFRHSPPLHNPLHADSWWSLHAESWWRRRAETQLKAKPIRNKRQWLHGANRGLAIDVGQRRWMSVSHSKKEDLEAKLISRRLVALLRRKTRFHDIEGACLWHDVMYQIQNVLQNVDSPKPAQYWMADFFKAPAAFMMQIHTPLSTH